MEYNMPSHKQWVPLKIVSAAYTLGTMKHVVGDQVQEGEIRSFSLDLIHVSSLYGQRSRPYKLVVPAENVMRAFHRGPHNGEMGFLVNGGTALLQATGLAESIQKVPLDEQEGLPKRMMSKNVMGRIRHRQIPTRINGEVVDKLSDTLYDNVLPVPGRDIQIHQKDGGVLDAQVTWDAISTFVEPENIAPGTTISAFIPLLGKTTTACRIEDQWHDLTEA